MHLKRILFLCFAFTFNLQSIGSELRLCESDKVETLVIENGRINLQGTRLLAYLKSTDICNADFVVNINFAYTNNGWILSPMRLIFSDRRPVRSQIDATVSVADSRINNSTAFVINLR